MKKIFFLSILFISVQLSAQTGGIRGKVIDKRTKQPLIGASVLVQNTTLGAATDSTGYYEIENVNEDLYKLKISFIGYQEFIKPDVRVIRRKVTQVEEISLTQTTLTSDQVTVTAGAFEANDDIPVLAHNLTLWLLHFI